MRCSATPAKGAPLTWEACPGWAGGKAGKAGKFFYFGWAWRKGRKGRLPVAFTVERSRAISDSPRSAHWAFRP